MLAFKQLEFARAHHGVVAGLQPGGGGGGGGGQGPRPLCKIYLLDNSSKFHPSDDAPSGHWEPGGRQRKSSKLEGICV